MFVVQVHRWLKGQRAEAKQARGAGIDAMSEDDADTYAEEKQQDRPQPAPSGLRHLKGFLCGDPMAPHVPMLKMLVDDHLVFEERGMGPAEVLRPPGRQL